MNFARHKSPSINFPFSRLFVGAALVFLFAVLSSGQEKRQLIQEKPNSSNKRIALVIGNGAYKKAKSLPNPANDAADMAKALKEVGFDEVLSGTDLTKRQMETLIRDFGVKLASGGVGLFYYAGHGLQVSGENFLVPIDAYIPQEEDVKYAAVSLGMVLSRMTTAKNNLNIVILDACRNNPFARSWRGYRDVGNNDGLAKISPPTGTLVLYSTVPGSVASDGTGRNGLFTEALLKQVRRHIHKIAGRLSFVVDRIEHISWGLSGDDLGRRDYLLANALLIRSSIPNPESH